MPKKPELFEMKARFNFGFFFSMIFNQLSKATMLSDKFLSITTIKFFFVFVFLRTISNVFI